MSDIDNLKTVDPEYRIAPALSRLADSVLGTVAAAILFCMMAVTAVDVFGRYLFNSPLQGGYEFTQLLMLSLVFAALPSVTRRTEHITVGLFENAFTGWMRSARDLTIALVVALGALYLGWRLYILAGRFDAFGDTTATSRIPLSPFAYGGALAMLICAVASLLLAVETLMTRRGDRGR
ncbi:MAG TPA: TRAP transporter small permease [Xanthobacteraceae bacterium]|nr:TRAP transporter small permease [Xanthobacteraceae bacterium]